MVALTTPGERSHFAVAGFEVTPPRAKRLSGLVAPGVRSTSG
jgi:hypothetical protein